MKRQLRSIWWPKFFLLLGFNMAFYACDEGSINTQPPINTNAGQIAQAGMSMNMPQAGMMGEVYAGMQAGMNSETQAGMSSETQAGMNSETQAGMNSGVMSAGSDQGGQAGIAMTAGMDTAGVQAPLYCEEGTACGASCVWTDRDPANCGGCGRTCVIPQASASCVAGQCQIADCALGYVDADGVLDNGCESESFCIEGMSCLTQCGSEGIERCQGTELTCEIPEESCNLIDDDCDGSCDEDWQNLDCRTPIHRGYGNGYHIYSDRLDVVAQNGTVEAQNYFYLSSIEVANSRPVFFCRNTMNRPFLSSLTDCGIPRSPEAVLGFWLTAPTCGASPLYHLATANEGDFFYTTSENEKDHAISLGFRDRGIAGYIWLP